MSLLSGDPRKTLAAFRYNYIFDFSLRQPSWQAGYAPTLLALTSLCANSAGYAHEKDLAALNLIAARASVYGELELLLLSSAARSKALTIE